MSRILPLRGPLAGGAGCVSLLWLLGCGSPERQYASQLDAATCSPADVLCAPLGESSASVMMTPPGATSSEPSMSSDSASPSAVAPLPSGSALPGTCSGEADCDDGVYCNGAEGCVDGSCQPSTAVACDDGVACTVDRCDELLGDCAFMPEHATCTDVASPLCDPVEGCRAAPCESQAECDDGSACNGIEQCNMNTGFCEAGAPIVCDDAVDCTHDACSEVSGGCEFDRDNSLCDDGAWCNGREVCKASGCADGPAPTLDDGIACTTDVCNESQDDVDHTGHNVTLTITGASRNFGRVTLNSEAQSCDAPPCEFDMPCNSRVIMTAWTSQTDGYGFSGWSGGGCSDVYDCDMTLGDDVTVNAEFAPANLAFTTSTTVTGDTGGVAGADAECQARAETAGLSGTFRAWLFTTYDYPPDRFGAAQGWVRPDGLPFANTAFEVDLGALYYPLILDEYGSRVADAAVRTGAGRGGNACQDWTAASTTNTEFGFNYSVGYTFQSMVLMPCDVPSALYCFQVDSVVAVRPMPATGRLAFVTREWFFPGGGLSAADGLCQREADEAGLPGEYAAQLATSTASAASRFDTSEPWMRPDGIRITSSADEMFIADHWDTAPNVSADGRDYFQTDPGWSGGTSLSSAGTLGDTCEDWTSTTGHGMAGRVTMSQVEARHFSDLVTCDYAFKLTCLQR